MASSLKSTLPAARVLFLGRAPLFGRSVFLGGRRSALAPDLVLAPPRRTYARADQHIPGAVAAYVWLAAALILAVCALVFALWLTVGLLIEHAAPWSGWRAI